jgi:tetratricopeptide (TPR) repeat protein
MSDPEEDDLPLEGGRPPEAPRFYNPIVDWWREATGQTDEWHLDMTPGQAIWRRILLWLPVVVLVLLLGGAAGFYAFTGWRAQDLARKATTSAEQGELRFALIQAESARGLRPRDPAVLRAYASVLAAADDRRTLAIWDQLAAAGPLSAEDRMKRAEAAVRFGNDAQFEAAIKVMEDEGLAAESFVWRGRRALQQKDFTNAERFFRRAAEQDPAPERRFELARLLAGINTPDSLAEAVQIVDAVAAGDSADEALAFGLTAVPAGPATRLAWAERAFAERRPGNQALLPAATVLVADRHRSVDEVVRELQLVFTGAGPVERGLYARWLLDHQRPADALIFVRAAEARGSRGTFLVRAEALSATEDWRGLLSLVEAGSPVSESVTQLLRARAETGLGRTAAAERSWARAVRGAVGRNQLPEVMAQVDQAGRSDIADKTLLELCAEHGPSEYALRVARWRFSQRGEPRLRHQAFRNALRASPQSPSVQDLARLERLMNGERVDSAETEAVLASEPSNLDFRLTHALALLRDGRAAEARKVLEPCEAIRHQLQSGQKAVVVAVLAATGSRQEAIALARTIRSNHLTDPEYRLVYQQTLADLPTIASPGEE